MTILLQETAQKRSDKTAVKRPTELSSRPERTRISYYAALINIHVCGFP